jgi:hypothetical protein
MSENGTEKPLSNRRRALEMLALGKKPADVARDLNIARSTVYRWMKSETFRADLRALDKEVMDSLARRLMSLSGTALAADQPAGLRLRAAVAVLERGPDLMERTDVLERLAELERSLRDESTG